MYDNYKGGGTLALLNLQILVHDNYEVRGIVAPGVILSYTEHRSIWCVTPSYCKQTRVIPDFTDNYRRISLSGWDDSFGSEIGKKRRGRRSLRLVALIFVFVVNPKYQNFHFSLNFPLLINGLFVITLRLWLYFDFVLYSV